MRGVEPQVVLALANLSTLANDAEGLTLSSLLQSDRSTGLDEERKRISRELHDGVAQELQAIVMHLRLALAGNPDKTGCPAAITALAIAERGLAMTRSLLADLHGSVQPNSTTSQSLARALNDSLREATRYSSIGVNLRVDEGVRVPHLVYAELTRMVREIAINAIKHANATTITCTTQRRTAATWCQVQICDDGVGFDLASTPAGCGIRGLRERARRMGGTVSIQSAFGQGTLVQLSFPTSER